MVLSGFWLVLALIAAVLVGIVLGTYLSRYTSKEYFRKNPPITEEMIASMLSSMGQAPTQKRVKQIMKKMQSDANK
ncbi:MAG: YneF family protein [Mycoplasmatales bacterium]